MTCNADTAAYTISRARSPKGLVVVRCPSRDGSKTRAARLAEGLRGRWTHRVGGYVMTPAKAARFERLYREGWDASRRTGELEPPERELPLPAPADDDLVLVHMGPPAAAEERLFRIPPPPEVITYRRLRSDLVPVLRRVRVLRAALRDVDFTERGRTFLEEILERANRQREAALPALLVARALAQPALLARAASQARQREICGAGAHPSLQNSALVDGHRAIRTGGAA